MPNAGIILCGGLSSRMGRPKAWLPFGDETLLARTVRLLQGSLDKLIVVAAEDQELPALLTHVQIARDAHPNRGPLEGLAAGLRALPRGTAGVFVTGCDAPLLRANFIAFVLAELQQHDAAVPLVEKLPRPLPAAYRPAVLSKIDDLLAAGQRSLQELLKHIHTHWLTAEALRHVDPELLSLCNVNTPDDYDRALRSARIS